MIYKRILPPTKNSTIICVWYPKAKPDVNVSEVFYSTVYFPVQLSDEYAIIVLITESIVLQHNKAQLVPDSPLNDL